MLLLFLVHYIPLAIYYIKLKMMTRRLSVLDIVIIILIIIVAAIVIYILAPLIIAIAIIAAGYFIYRWYKSRSSWT